MYKNTHIIDKTNKEIIFSWEDVLNSSPAFKKDPAYSYWTAPNGSTIAAGERELHIHPGKKELNEEVIALLEKAASIKYDCRAKVRLDENIYKWDVVLKAKTAAPLTPVVFGNYPQHRRADRERERPLFLVGAAS